MLVALPSAIAFGVTIFAPLGGSYAAQGALAGVGLWKWQSLVVGVVTVAVMLFATKVTKAVPAAILALVAGLVTYFAIALDDRSLLTLAGNHFVVGPLGTSSAGFLDSIAL